METTAGYISQKQMTLMKNIRVAIHFPFAIAKPPTLGNLLGVVW